MGRPILGLDSCDHHFQQCYAVVAEAARRNDTRLAAYYLQWVRHNLPLRFALLMEWGEENGWPDVGTVLRYGPR